METDAETHEPSQTLRVINATVWLVTFAWFAYWEPRAYIIPALGILAFCPWFNKTWWGISIVISLAWMITLSYQTNYLGNYARYYTDGDFYLSVAGIVVAHIMVFAPIFGFTQGKWNAVTMMGGLLVSTVIGFFLILPFLARAREKPVIYLYPESSITINVQLDYDGELTHSYPAYGDDGWTIKADPDGTLRDPETGREHYCLFWEGKDDEAYTLETGTVVAGEDTVSFLEDALSKLGLTDREANEFIIYWQPRLESNRYNLIHFATEEYARRVPMHVTPKPDSVIRIMMVYRPLSEPIDIEAQTFSAPERKGFTVVEWGGTEIPAQGFVERFWPFS